MDVVKEYLNISYNANKNQGAKSVQHLITEGGGEFIANTFPDVKTITGYTEIIKEFFEILPDFTIKQFDIMFESADKSKVAVHYVVQASHSGKEFGEGETAIGATGKTACWSASTIFELQGNKIKKMWKDWDRISMYGQLGWTQSVFRALSAQATLEPLKHEDLLRA